MKKCIGWCELNLESLIVCYVYGNYFKFSSCHSFAIYKHKDENI
jgi:hypothetical protein